VTSFPLWAEQLFNQPVALSRMKNETLCEFANLRVTGTKPAKIDVAALEGVQMRAMSDAEKRALICAHPDLAGRLALPVEGNLVAAAGLDVPVDAVVADVELAAQVPAGVGRLPAVQPCPGLRPVEAGRLGGPQLLEAALVDVGPGIGLGGEGGGRREAALLHLHRLDRVLGRPGGAWRSGVGHGSRSYG